jgi:hypothetical protein
MLFFIALHGGLQIMMGQHARSESPFYCFRIEDQVPENHLLRLLDRHISSISFVRSCRTPTAIRADPRSIRNSSASC